MKLTDITKKIDAPAVVAGAAFLASAGHIVSVVDETNHILFALAYPLGIDGLLYVGMKKLKERRFAVGVIALVVGTFFSLAFNAHAEGALVVPRIIIAFSMPICLLAAFVIEHMGKTAEVKTEVQTQTIVKTVAPALLPIVPFVRPLPAPASRWVAAGARWTLPIIPAAPAPIKAKASVRRPAAKPIEGRTDAPALTDGRTDGRTVRPAAWDVEKAIRLVQDGRTNADVAAAAGTNEKAIQRARRAMKLITAQPPLNDDQIAEMMNRDVSPAHVARIRAAMTKENA